MSWATFVPNMLDEAVEARASDIHIEPGKKHVRIRFRIDGTLRLYRLLPMARCASLLSQLKIMADMDIGEKRLPQDGGFSRENIEIQRQQFRHFTVKKWCCACYSRTIRFHVWRNSGWTKGSSHKCKNGLYSRADFSSSQVLLARARRRLCTRYCVS